MLVLQPASGLHFPAIETLREALLSRALESTWPVGLRSPPAPGHPLSRGSCWTPRPCSQLSGRSLPVLGSWGSRASQEWRPVDTPPPPPPCMHAARVAGSQHVSLRARSFQELVFRGEKGLFACPVKEMVVAVSKQPMFWVLVLSPSRAHWGGALDGLVWPHAPGQSLFWQPLPGVTTPLYPQHPRHALQPWTAPTSAALTTRWCWGSGSSWRTSTSGAPPSPSLACRWVSASALEVACEVCVVTVPMSR